MRHKLAICWFRQDLRVSDQPALIEALKHNQVLPIYIFDDTSAGIDAMGAASRIWLHHSLASLNQSLGGALSVYQGEADKIINELTQRFQIEAIYWNRCYEPWRIQRDKAIKAQLKQQGIQVQTFNGSLLWEPWQVLKKEGMPYQVFTPFYRRGCLNAPEPRIPFKKSDHVSHCIGDPQQNGLKRLNLLPKENWYQALVSHWSVGEQGAHKCAQQFIETGLPYYKMGRDMPASPYVSKLSPHIHFGEISPNQLWHAVQQLPHNESIDHFCSELGWREFSYTQLYYQPNLPRKNLQSKFDQFLWRTDEKLLKAWQRGQTGIPMVDAGMRQLWQTGYMHNRVRMIVGSFLVKNLRLDWRHGAAWFWDTLFDADLASNSASWQWIAGCGADAAPYFRIFNPVIQGKKFDPDGDYVRTYIPELAALPNRYLFEPWEAPASTLAAAGMVLGSTYPHPIVDLKQSRNEALEAFQLLKK